MVSIILKISKFVVSTNNYFSSKPLQASGAAYNRRNLHFNPGFLTKQKECERARSLPPRLQQQHHLLRRPPRRRRRRRRRRLRRSHRRTMGRIRRGGSGGGAGGAAAATAKR